MTVTDATMPEFAGPEKSQDRDHSHVFQKSAWLSNPKADLLSGLVVSLALIPEAISFSIIAGVDPKVGLYASFSIAIIISMTGGRMGMISAATGAMALVVVPLVKEENGLALLFAATISPVRCRSCSACWASGR